MSDQKLSGISPLASRRQMLKLSLGATALIAGLGAVRSAYAMGVTPFSIDLGKGGKGMSGNITVENNFPDPLPVELRVEALTFDANGVVETKTDPGDLVVFPAQALIQPGQSRVFRIQYAGPAPTDASKHYYVTAAQLPVDLQGEQGAQVQVVYAFNVLVSVAVAGAKANLRLTSATIGKNEDGHPEPVLTLENSSVTYGYFKTGRLKLAQKDAAGKVVFEQSYNAAQLEQIVGLGLIGPGQTRHLPFKVQLPSAEGTLTAEYSYAGG